MKLLYLLLFLTSFYLNDSKVNLYLDIEGSFLINSSIFSPSLILQLNKKTKHFLDKGDKICKIICSLSKM